MLGLDGLVNVLIGPVQPSTYFDVQDPGDFTPVGPFYQTGTFGAVQGASISTCLSGQMLSPGPSSFNVVVYLDGDPVFSEVIVAPNNFQEIGSPGTQVLLSDLYGVPGGPAGPLLPPSQASTTPQYVVLDGTLVIDEDYDFVANTNLGVSEIVMKANAKIIVEPGVTFRILGNFFTDAKSLVYGCGSVWDKIEVREGANVQFVLAQIEDGENALFVNKNDDATLNPTLVDLRGNIFLNNGNAVVTEDNGSSKNEIDLIVEGNNFIRDENAYNNFSAGMRLNDMQYTQISNIFAGSFFVGSVFRGLHVGIAAMNTDLDVYAVHFEDMKYMGIGVYDLSTLSLKNNSFTQNNKMLVDGGYGVYAHNSDIDIDKYDFEAPRGIRNSGVFSGEMAISACDIQSSLIGIDVFNMAYEFADIYSNPLIYKTGTSAGHAIRLSNNFDVGDNFNVNSNEIILMEGGTNCIEINNCENILLKENSDILNWTNNKNTVVLNGGKFNHIDCNNISGGVAGILLSGSYNSRIGCNFLNSSDRSLQVFGLCESSKIRGNDFMGDNVDLVYGLNPNSSFAVTGRQPEGAFDDMHGNIFNNLNSSGFDAIHYDPLPQNVEDSRYLVSNNLGNGNNYVPINWQASGAWFLPGNIFQETFTCPEIGCYIPGLLPPGPDSTVDEKIKDGSLNAGLYSAAVNWTGAEHLYERLQNSTTVPPEFSEFLQTNEGSSIGQFFKINDDLKTALQFSSTDKTTLQMAYENKTNLQDSIQVIRSEWAVAGIPFYEFPLDDLDEINNELNQINETINTIYKARKKLVMNLLPDLLISNNAVQVSSTHEQNKRDVNNIYFDFLLSESETLNDVQLLAIESVAHQCPLSGGDAVFQARGLLVLTDSIYTFDDEALCMISPGLQMNNYGGTKQLATEIKVYPNPATSVIEIRWPDLLEDGMIVLTDVNGRELLRYSVKQQNSATIDVSKLPSGIYQGKLSSSTQPDYYFKAILSK